MSAELHIAGLELLLAAVHADDPKREILVRVGDAIREARALAAHQDGVRNALHEIVTNGEHTEDGGWKVSAEVYQLAYDADLFGGDEQDGARAPEGYTLVPNVALEWLDGSAPDTDGKWFGEYEEADKRPYWWRWRFRKLAGLEQSVRTTPDV